MRIQLLKQLLVCVCLVLSGSVLAQTGYHYSNQTPLIISPVGSVVPASVEFIGRNVGRILWTDNLNHPHIVEHKSILGYNNGWSTEVIAPSGSQRSVVMNNIHGFYRVQRVASYGTGRPVLWSVSIPSVLPSVFLASTATWTLEETGETKTVPASTTVTNYFNSTSAKTVKVTVRSADGSEISKRWAIMITNSMNLIRNGDFAEGDNTPIGWNMGGYGMNTAVFEYPAFSGVGVSNKAARLTVSNHIDGDAKWYFDDVSVSGGKRYRYSTDFRSTAASQVVVRYKIGPGDNNFSYVLVAPVGVSTNWTNLVTEFIAPSNALSLTVFHLLPRNGTLVIDNVSLTTSSPPITPLSKGYVSIDFDDGWADAYDAATNILVPRGFRATYYIVSTQTDRPTFMSWSNILEAENFGNEIGSHTVEHLSLSTLGAADLAYEINLSKQILINHGVKRVNALAYPYGSYNVPVKKAAEEAGYLCARTVDGDGYNSKESIDMFGLRCKGIEVNTPIESVKGWINEALERKEWLILLFHQVNQGGGQYSVTANYLTEVANYLQFKNASVITTTEGARLMSQRP